MPELIQEKIAELLEFWDHQPKHSWKNDNGKDLCTISLHRVIQTATSIHFVLEGRDA